MLFSTSQHSKQSFIMPSFLCLTLSSEFSSFPQIEHLTILKPSFNVPTVQLLSYLNFQSKFFMLVYSLASIFTNISYRFRYTLTLKPGKGFEHHCNKIFHLTQVLSGIIILRLSHLPDINEIDCLAIFLYINTIVYVCSMTISLGYITKFI